jgi:putative GTP pyrophosphokinase
MVITGIVEKSISQLNIQQHITGIHMHGNYRITHSFDFDQHREAAVRQYRFVRGLYEEFAEVVRHILGEAFNEATVKIHSIEARAKSLKSFERKAARPSASDPNLPRYRDPLSEITDLAGVRVITFFPKTLKEVDSVIHSEFRVIEKKDKKHYHHTHGRFGYRSVHYLIRMKPERSALPEYRCFAKLTAEIQVRTILQHAWAEMEHDIRYKSTEVIPASIRKRFDDLAQTIEAADREFQTIQDEDQMIRDTAIRNVLNGNLEDAGILPDTLKSYLDARFGPDGRMTWYSYDFVADILKKMGFTSLKEVDDCIAEYDDDQICRALRDFRQGQLRRFEYTLIAGMGDGYARLHPWTREKKFSQRSSNILKTLHRKNIATGSYVPRGLGKDRPQ